MSINKMGDKLSNIPIIIESGRKYTNHHGIKAIKDGMSNQQNRRVASQKKPAWLKVKLTHDAK